MPINRKPFTEEQKEIIRKLYAQKHGSPYIAKKLGVTIGKITRFLEREGIMRSCSEAAKKYQCNENFFKNIDTEEKAYWLGFFYADGYVSSANQYSYCIGLSLKRDDKSHIKKFKTTIQSNHPIHDYKTNGSAYKKGTEYSRIIITSKIMYEDAVRQGIVEHKTNIVTPPNIDASLYPAFIRGYFDGDGCVTFFPHNGRMDAAIKILGTTDFLDFIREFVQQHEIAKRVNKYYQRKENQEVRSFEFAGVYQVKKFLDIIYNNATVYLDRKYDKYIELSNYLNSRVTSKDVA